MQLQSQLFLKSLYDKDNKLLIIINSMSCLCHSFSAEMLHMNPVVEHEIKMM